MIIAIMATTFVPQLWRRAPRYERNQFIGKLSSLTRFAQQHAITTNRLHQIFFDLAAGTVTLKEQGQGRDEKGEQSFVPLKDSPFPSIITIPSQLQIKQFFIDGSDAMSAFVGRPTEKVWFFIVPNGLSQSVIINMVDTKQLVAGRPKPVGLVLNPFTLQLNVHDEFQK